MTVERKNSLTFGSHDGAEVSVIYHTFIETCKMCGVSTLEYFKEFFKAAIKRGQRELVHFAEREQVRIIFKAIMQGRTVYENMLSMISVLKILNFNLVRTRQVAKTTPNGCFQAWTLKLTAYDSLNDSLLSLQ